MANVPAWDNFTFKPEDVARFEGKTIERVEAEGSHGRTRALVLTFTDGSTAKLGFWAVYADDSGLELEWSEGDRG